MALEDLLKQLEDCRSDKRRSAAKKLRALAEPSAAPTLLRALGKVIEDPRTWETQYQLIMAIAASKSLTAITLLERIAASELEPMVLVAAGDALVRLAADPDRAVLDALRSGSLPRKGLAAVGVSDGDLSKMAEEFQAGMRGRAASLGDVDDNWSRFGERARSPRPNLRGMGRLQREHAPLKLARRVGQHPL